MLDSFATQSSYESSHDYPKDFQTKIKESGESGLEAKKYIWHLY